MLVRQDDVQADGFGSRVGRATIRRFHDSGTAARHNDKVAPAINLASARYQPAKLTSLVEVSREGYVPGRDCNGSTVRWIAGMLREFCFSFDQQLPGLSWFRQSRTSEHNDRRANTLLALDQIRLEKFQTKTN